MGQCNLSGKTLFFDAMCVAGGCPSFSDTLKWQAPTEGQDESWAGEGGTPVFYWDAKANNGAGAYVIRIIDPPTQFTTWDCGEGTFTADVANVYIGGQEKCRYDLSITQAGEGRWPRFGKRVLVEG